MWSEATWSPASERPCQNAKCHDQCDVNNRKISQVEILADDGTCGGLRVEVHGHCDLMTVAGSLTRSTPGAILVTLILYMLPAPP